MIKSGKKKIIPIKCKTLDSLPWRQITPLQGNYKKRSREDIDKLKKSIVTYGIRFPGFVTKLNKINYALDTHGRLLAYEELEQEGWTIPPVPIVYVEAKDKQEATQLLLRVDSRFGEVDEEGFKELIKDIKVDLSDLSIVGINLDNINDIETDIEVKEVNYKEKTELIIECSNEKQAEKLYGEFIERGLKCRISTL